MAPFDGPEIRSHVVHLLVGRVVELEDHFLVCFVRILHVDLREASVRIARDRFARAVGEREDDEPIRSADERAFDLRAVGHRHGHGVATAATTTAPAATAAATTEATALSGD